MIARAGLVAMLVASQIASAASPVRADPSRLAPWTTALRDAQPDQPWMIVYRKGAKRLVFVAAQHENATDSPTFRLIEAAFTLWPVRSVVVEGIPGRLGANPSELVAIATRARPDPAIDPDGETGPAVRQARLLGANLHGGEPDDAAVRDLARRDGIDDPDLLGFYTLRVIPQWVRDGSITGPADPRLAPLVDRQLDRGRTELALPDDVMPDAASFAAWYRRTNGKPLAGGVDPEEVGPLVDGPWPTNRIGAAIARARDAYLIDEIATRLNADNSVLIVFGGSHAMIDRPALDAMMGRPCYVGSDARVAILRCRSRPPQAGPVGRRRA